jgi:hypothetical protein
LNKQLAIRALICVIKQWRVMKSSKESDWGE